MPFLPPNQQRQGTEGSKALKAVYYYYYYYYKYGRPPLLNNKCLDDEISTHMHAHTQPFNSPLSESTKVSWYQKKHSGFYWSKRWWSGSGIIWKICKTASRSRKKTTMPIPHPMLLQAGCSSCHPTNSVKALITSHQQAIWECFRPGMHVCMNAQMPPVRSIGQTDASKDRQTVLTK